MLLLRFRGLRAPFIGVTLLTVSGATQSGLAGYSIQALQQVPPPRTSAPASGRGVPAQGAEPDLALVEKFDEDGNGRLNWAERLAARKYLDENPGMRRTARGNRVNRVGTPGVALTPKDIRTYPASVPLYDGATLRTLFLQFEDNDWEQELVAFYHSDVLVPATLVVDGRTYHEVGVSFRGNNSFGAVPDGLKRPLSIAMDFVHDQHLLGHRSLNLLNSNQDPTFLRSVLYLDVARQYIPAVKANFARVVINGESWGLYVNQQTFSKEFVQEAFKTDKGTRWKSPNNSVGGGFSYLGEDVALYRRWYEMKGRDNLDAWRALVGMTRVLNQTPTDGLARAIEPLMDVDEVLRFLALDIALANGDGYWNDGSDFNVFLTPGGKFLATPHDANEGFRGRGPAAAQPDPLVNLTDPNKALRHKLLAVPEYRDRYLKYIGEIANTWLDWNRLGPMVARYQKLIADDVAKDTRKLDTTEAFLAGIHGAAGAPPAPTTLRGFADARRAFLLAHPEIVRAGGR